MSRSRAWCFTLNNYTEDEVKTLRDSTRYKYLLMGFEVGENGTPHIQGYMVLKQPATLTAMKKHNSRAHWEQAKGNVDHNYEYCTKDGDFVEHGVKPITPKQRGAAGGEKEKKRWEDARKAAMEGRLEDVPADIFYRYYNATRQIMKDFAPMPPDADDVTGVWIYGPAGVGKSRKARADYPNAYFKPCNKWWDGYKGQDNVIIDDVDTKHDCLGHHLKIWADRYGFTAEIKGGAINARPKKIVVTSQYSIEDIWSDCETREALKRRFKVIHMDPMWS